MHGTIAKVILKALGTGVLAVGFVFLVGRAPFIADSTGGRNDEQIAAQALYPLPANLKIGTSALLAPNLPALPEITEEGISVSPSLGLFNASFATSDGSSGFATTEFEVPGSCDGAGLRFVRAECPTCELIGNSNDTDMLLWQQSMNGREVVRTVSKNCLRETPESIPVVGTLLFEEGAADLAGGQSNISVGIVPLLPGATRVASINLGAWFVTYDEIPRPSTALVDMARALSDRGWRKVSDEGLLNQDAFQGQRVFTNSANATCIISLTKQDNIYQLMTVINSRA